MKRNQSGFTLLEMLIVIGLASILSVILGTIANDSQRNVKEQNTAQYQKRVMAATSAWIKDNYSTVTATATTTTPHKLNVATLVAANYLPAGYSSVNPYNQTTCILTLEPAANKLETVVVTEGGVEIQQGRVPTVANLVGSSGGYIMPDNVTAQGSFGGWSRNISSFIADNCSGTAATKNHLAGALFLDGSDLLNDYLYRSAVPGHPEANTMTTPLLISSVKAVGDACTTTGSITTAADGALLTCQAGAYAQQGSAYWKDPVTNFASLPTCNASAAWQTRIVQTPTTGTGARAYTCNGTGTWNALAVNDSGNLVLPGTASVGKIQVNDVVTENTACSPNGLVARDSVGLILSCQSGSWKKAQGTSSRNGVSYSDISISSCSGSWCMAVATCSSGKTLATYSCSNNYVNSNSTSVTCQSVTDATAIAYCK